MIILISVVATELKYEGINLFVQYLFIRRKKVSSLEGLFIKPSFFAL